MTNVTIMAIPAEVQTYLDDVNARVRKIAAALHEALTELGCNSYVKTIYIGYDINGEKTAAEGIQPWLHPDSKPCDL